jgi:hypothetical protein
MSLRTEWATSRPLVRLLRAEPLAQDLSHLQDADGRPVGQRQEALAGRLGRGHRADVQIGHVAHIGDAEALASAR